jgi:S1-C subfamily serine protease
MISLQTPDSKINTAHGEVRRSNKEKMKVKPSITFLVKRASMTLVYAAIVYSNVYAAGVAAFKEQSFHADAEANPIAYVQFVESSGPFIKINTGKKELLIEKSKCAGRVEVLSEMPPTIVNESDITPIRKSLADLSNFVKRFPKSAPLLQNQITALGGHIGKFDAGNIRHKGEWITKQAYAVIQADDQKVIDEIRNQDLATAEQNRIRREKEEAFAAEQRSKGLEQYGDKWLPVAEVRILRERDATIAKAWASISDKTVTNGIYSIFQVTDDGMLIQFRSGQIRQGGVNTDIAFLFGAAKGMAADGDFYKGTLYWCGTYSYTSYAGYSKTVNAYALEKDDAIKRVCSSLDGDSSVASNNGKTRGGERNAKSSNTPEPLIGASASGSGFFIGNEGYFVTNNHVVEGASKVFVFFGGKKLKAELVKVSKVADLALLKVESAIQGIAISNDEAEPGQDVFAIGFPQPAIQGLEVKVTKGVISSNKGFNDDDTRFQIDAAVQLGNSGGPLCNESGLLVGVVVSGLDQIAIANATGTIPQNVNYAIKASEVSALLRAKSIKLDESGNEEKESGSSSSIKTACSVTGLVIVH